MTLCFYSEKIARKTFPVRGWALHVHRRRKRGVCRGSDTPTIYVGDIDTYIPLEKSNRAYLAMQTVCKTYWDAGKGNLTAQNTRKHFGGRGSVLDPVGGAYSAPENPYLAGCPLPENPFPRCRPFVPTPLRIVSAGNRYLDRNKLEVIAEGAFHGLSNVIYL